MRMSHKDESSMRARSTETNNTDNRTRHATCSDMRREKQYELLFT